MIIKEKEINCGHFHSFGDTRSDTLIQSSVKKKKSYWVLTVDLVDLRVGRQDLISQLLSGGQHLGVVGRDQVLDQLLQLVPVHLEQRLRDGQPQLHLQRREEKFK